MRQPNILFFLPDQHRADWLGIEGSLPLRTPNLDALCRRGIRFRNAFTPSPLCAPARACLATGRNYSDCGVPSNRECLPSGAATYYQSLRAAGYEVCGVGKFDLHKNLACPTEALDWNLDGSLGLEEWGFTSGIDNEGKLDGSASYVAAGRPKGPYMAALAAAGYAEQYVSEHRNADANQRAYVTALPDHLYCDNWIAANGLQFLSSFTSQRPWHLVVNFAGPHEPMDVTADMAARWEGVTFPLPHNPGDTPYSEFDHQRSRRHYAAMIENIDRHIGDFLRLVEERGEWENTLIVFASDHGEMLGDHGLWGKATWRDPALRIPMILAGPGIVQGKNSPALVSLQDLSATFLELAGACPLAASTAVSMVPVATGAAASHRESVCSALGDWNVIMNERYKTVTKAGDGPQLFDLSKEPYEDAQCHAPFATDSKEAQTGC